MLIFSRNALELMLMNGLHKAFTYPSVTLKLCKMCTRRLDGLSRSCSVNGGAKFVVVVVLRMVYDCALLTSSESPHFRVIIPTIVLTQTVVSNFIMIRSQSNYRQAAEWVRGRRMLSTSSC